MSALLDVRGLTIEYMTTRGAVRAVDDVSFTLQRGETLALVGESGSGKSTVALGLLRLISPSSGRIAAGSVIYNGRDLAKLPEREMRLVRGAEIGTIFQDPAMALNPVHTIGRQIAETMLLHNKATAQDAMDRAIELLRLVGVPAPADRIRQYPHNLSGGMRQRVMIAMALACGPSLLIADEPTTALDVTVQAQVLALIADLKQKLDMAVLLITHDLAVVSSVADRVVVLYGGRIVEQGPVPQVFADPRHPYTKGLLDASDWSDDDGRERLRDIPGAIPSLGNMPTGCAFSPRCPVAIEPCRTVRPRHVEVGRDRTAACLLSAGGLE
jgi:oligopeptide/dipeptide ABC transporter ATP-binding protein